MRQEVGRDQGEIRGARELAHMHSPVVRNMRREVGVRTRPKAYVDEELGHLDRIRTVLVTPEAEARWLSKIGPLGPGRGRGLVAPKGTW